MYHDLHGNEGLRTRLMTLWQMMIIAALAITIGQSPGKRYANTTVVLMIMQLYITYMWWSVGFYDKNHRRYNKPYTILYLASFALMGLSIALPSAHLKWIVPLVIVFNYSPPFIARQLLRRSSLDINLSSSMSERLGLFTIIVFGEVVLGVVNGISSIVLPDFLSWLSFALGIIIVFALWWIFFTLTSNRQAKTGFLNASLLELLYIPALISLGLIAACFTYLFDPNDIAHSLHTVLDYALVTYFICISGMMGLLEYPDIVRNIKLPIRISLLVTALIFLAYTLIHLNLDTLYYLLATIIILVAEIIYLNSLYYSLNAEERNQVAATQE